MRKYSLQQDRKVRRRCAMWVSGLKRDAGAVYTFPTRKEMQAEKLEMYRLRNRVFRDIESKRIKEENVSMALMEAFRSCRIYAEDECTFRVVNEGLGFKAVDFEDVNSIDNEVYEELDMTPEEKKKKEEFERKMEAMFESGEIKRTDMTRQTVGDKGEEEE